MKFSYKGPLALIGGMSCLVALYFIYELRFGWHQPNEVKIQLSWILGLGLTALVASWLANLKFWISAALSAFLLIAPNVFLSNQVALDLAYAGVVAISAVFVGIASHLISHWRSS